jgi:hypothetical protein
MIQDIGYVLHQHGRRLTDVYITEQVTVQACPRVVSESLGMAVDLAKLGSSDTRECPAGRTADNHVKGSLDRTKVEFLSEDLRRDAHIARLVMLS